jgi:hypothetical protein
MIENQQCAWLNHCFDLGGYTALEQIFQTLMLDPVDWYRFSPLPLPIG